MPTPYLFTEISRRAAPYKRYYLGVTGIGFILVLLATLATVKFEVNIATVIGVGIITIFWAWGIFLIISWYSKKTIFDWKLPKFLQVGISWYVAIFLDVWFIVGTFWPLLFIWSSFLE